MQLLTAISGWGVFLFIPNKQYLHISICSCQVILLFTSPGKLSENKLNKSSPNFLEWGALGADRYISEVSSGVVSGSPTHTNVTPKFSVQGHRLRNLVWLGFEFFCYIYHDSRYMNKKHPNTEQPRKVNTEIKSKPTEGVYFVNIAQSPRAQGKALAKAHIDNIWINKRTTKASTIY